MAPPPLHTCCVGCSVGWIVHEHNPHHYQGVAIFQLFKHSAIHSFKHNNVYTRYTYLLYLNLGRQAGRRSFMSIDDFLAAKLEANTLWAYFCHYQPISRLTHPNLPVESQKSFFMQPAAEFFSAGWIWFDSWLCPAYNFQMEYENYKVWQSML